MRSHSTYPVRTTMNTEEERTMRLILKYNLTDAEYSKLIKVVKQVTAREMEIVIKLRQEKKKKQKLANKNKKKHNKRQKKIINRMR